mmetsp:Transcript_19701/g.35664  ORF Transcript_19701/g.35664 Transcript_19701/m.35664 type:complete len:447 (+) Transcript_19701:79-1419(+)
MVKVKILQRSEEDFGRSYGSVEKLFRNPDPELHPMERAREYQRALTAVKMEKMFAKPFICALDGHTDSVKCLHVARQSAAPLISGGCDGALRSWNLQYLKLASSVDSAHTGFVRGVVVSPSGDRLVSCGDDKAAKLWQLQPTTGQIQAKALSTYHSTSISGSIDHHWGKPLFITTGDTVDVWDYERSTPLSSFEWGCERVITAKFNPAEPSLVASTAADRSVGLYDLRGNSAIRKVILKLRSNAVCWNPMAPMNFTVANEDGELYTFDMRKLEQARQRHWDHVMAVLDVAYHPTGQEFVSASYDMTVRIWSVDAQRSRDVYHTRRMQRVLCCQFSPDGRFILTGSEDTNVRVWKTNSDQKLGVLSEREKRAVHYRETLKKKFGRLPEIAKIKRHKHVPKMIKSISRRRHIMRQSKLRKERNVLKHSKPGTKPAPKMKQRPILKEVQ